VLVLDEIQKLTGWSQIATAGCVPLTSNLRGGRREGTLTRAPGAASGIDIGEERPVMGHLLDFTLHGVTDALALRKFRPLNG